MRRRILVFLAVLVGAVTSAGATPPPGDGLTPAQREARARLVRQANDPALAGIPCGCRHRWPGDRTLPADR